MKRIVLLVVVFATICGVAAGAWVNSAQAITKRQAIRKTNWTVAAGCIQHGCNEALMISAHCAGPFSGWYAPHHAQWNCDAWNWEKNGAGACHYWVSWSAWGRQRFLNRDCFGISQN